MKNNSFRILIFLSVISGSFSELSSQTRLPDLTLNDTESNPVQISSFINNKPTAIIFWATWCKPCIEELDNISDLYFDRADELDFDMVAVCIDDSRSSSSIRAFTNGKDWPFKVLIDDNQDLKRTMNITDIPAYIVFDKEGNITSRHTGYSEGNEYIMFEEIRKANEDK